jgi:hypothetical protein
MTDILGSRTVHVTDCGRSTAEQQSTASHGSRGEKSCCQTLYQRRAPPPTDELHLVASCCCASMLAWPLNIKVLLSSPNSHFESLDGLTRVFVEDHTHTQLTLKSNIESTSKST